MIDAMHTRPRYARDDAPGVGAAVRTLVLGAGTTGLAVARFLTARGEAVTVADDRADPPAADALRALSPALRLAFGGFDEALLDGVSRVVVSPGLPPTTPLVRAARDRGLPVVGELDLFFAVVEAPVIAVTGTNGKSTVTTLVAELLCSAGRVARAGGNLGPAALDLLSGARPDYYVLEISSFQLEQTPSAPARAAAVLNVSPDHLDRHGSMETYAGIKARVYDEAEVCVVNRDDPRVSAMLAPDRRQIGFTLGMPARGDFGLREADGRTWLCRGDERLAAADGLAVAGRHNLANALAALALAEAAGVPAEETVRGLTGFRSLPHRCETVAVRQGVRWIDDSKGTNLGATLAAVEGLGGPLILIAGGVAKDRDFAPLAAALESRARAVVLLGRDADLIAAALADVLPVHRAADMRDAVAAAAALAAPGDTVLLSPACASQDMFADYRDRGRQFAAALKELPA